MKKIRSLKSTEAARPARPPCSESDHTKGGRQCKRRSDYDYGGVPLCYAHASRRVLEAALEKDDPGQKTTSYENAKHILDSILEGYATSRIGEGPRFTSILLVPAMSEPYIFCGRKIIVNADTYAALHTHKWAQRYMSVSATQTMIANLPVVEISKL